MKAISIEEFAELESGRTLNRGRYYNELKAFLESEADAAELDAFNRKNAAGIYRAVVMRKCLPITIIGRDGKVFALLTDDAMPTNNEWQKSVAAAANRGEYIMPPDICDTVDCLLARLNDRERETVEMRFRDGLTLKECGEKLGVTRERVRQIQLMALRKIRESGSMLSLGINEYERRKAEEDIAQKNRLQEIDQQIQNGKITPIEILDFSVRSYTALRKSGITSVDHLVYKLTELGESGFLAWCLSLRGVGVASANEILNGTLRFTLKEET